MTKKAKKTSQKKSSDDLIDSLLNEVNSEEDTFISGDYTSKSNFGKTYSSSEDEAAVITPIGDSDEPPIGLDIKSEKSYGSQDQIAANMAATKAEQFWSEAEKEVSPIDFPLPSVDDEKPKFDGPSIGDGQYQSPDDLMKSQSLSRKKVVESESIQSEIVSSKSDRSEVAKENEESELVEKISEIANIEKTQPISVSSKEKFQSHTDEVDKTVAVTAFAQRHQTESKPLVEEKIVIGSSRPSAVKSGLVHTSVDASLAQAENLRMAQQRILDLEKEIDRLREENNDLSVAGNIVRQKNEEISSRLLNMEKERLELQESLENEIMVLKGNMEFKEAEVIRLRDKVEELEVKLRTDFKKIRIRERELENRLELAKAEKFALVRAKDENILDLQRKLDHLKNEMDSYRSKILELNKTIETYQEQMKRTVRALRLALTNLEVKDEEAVHYKKAE